ncbi:activating signal cointegrator 1 isoform X2 [Cuculus canorus]|nr:activating signal cointegrator 1 isoform X2 [Cuculus canorus]
MLSIRSEEEIREYIVDLLQGTDGKKSQFVEELLARWQKSSQLPAEPLPGYRKKDETLEAPRAGDQAKKGKRKGRNKQETPVYAEPSAPVEEVKTPLDLAKAQESSSGASSSASSFKKKPKYVSLYSKEGQDKLAVLIPGRHACECLGQKHKLVNNCLDCGRIVCVQEGSGPCLFCGALGASECSFHPVEIPDLTHRTRRDKAMCFSGTACNKGGAFRILPGGGKVCTKEEQDILQRDSNKSQKLLKKLMAGAESSGNLDAISKDLLPQEEARLKAGLEMAVKHKDKLLEFDRTSVRRTQVIDDESDYFATDSNQWLSKQEREALQKREQELRELRHASRLTRKITIDFTGRQILEEDSAMAEYHSKLDETIKAINSGTLSQPAVSPEAKTALTSSGLVNPCLLQPAPVWVDQTGLLPHRRATHSLDTGNEPGSERNRLRIQDRELQEISDDGWCLSMHQPWASLLVRGIKRVEGRTWYTSHRGRLWIAATAKRPSPQEISELEAAYRMLLQKGMEFPSDYPSGCLLGCVDVTDCLSQEQFNEQYPDLSQESSSPFVFICTNPQEMVVKFPIKGKHKSVSSKVSVGSPLATHACSAPCFVCCSACCCRRNAQPLPCVL